MIRKETYSIETILPLISLPKIELDNDLVNANSVRLLNFKLHGLTCVSCGITGEFFAKEKHSKRDKQFHLNLYAIKDGKEILMTKDHIIPKCENGSEQLENMQTMCSPCNLAKSLNSKIKVEIKNGASKELKQKLNYLQDRIKDPETSDVLDSLIRLINKTFCDSIKTTCMGTIPSTNIKEHDTHHTSFIDIGNNVTVVHNSNSNEECKSFYIFNKKTHERLHIYMKETIQTTKGEERPL
jgi:5-methylcytosine-specific restriction endonuclease McrA